MAGSSSSPASEVVSSTTAFVAESATSTGCGSDGTAHCKELDIARILIGVGIFIAFVVFFVGYCVLRACLCGTRTKYRTTTRVITIPVSGPQDQYVHQQVPQNVPTGYGYGYGYAGYVPPNGVAPPSPAPMMPMEPPHPHPN